jgi:hypothetical protein
MSKIHRPPRGLQHLLGSQSFGQNPDELAQSVQPTLDLTGYYSSELLKTAVVTGALAADGQVGSITFNAPVAIVAMGCEASTAISADEFVSWDLRLDDLGGTGQAVPVYESLRSQYFSGDYISTGFMLPYPLVVPGGCTARAFLRTYSGNLLTIQFRVLYVDLNPVDDS